MLKKLLVLAVFTAAGYAAANLAVIAGMNRGYGRRFVPFSEEDERLESKHAW